MTRIASIGMIVAVAACHSSTAPVVQGDNPSAIVGYYGVASVNGATAFPATIEKDTLTVQLGDATLTLFADGTYLSDQYIYEVRAVTKGIPQTGSGHFALHGAAVEFVAASGTAPESAAVVGTSLRVVQSVRAGRKADTLVFARRVVALQAR